MNPIILNTDLMELSLNFKDLIYITGLVIVAVTQFFTFKIMIVKAIGKIETLEKNLEDEKNQRIKNCQSNYEEMKHISNGKTAQIKELKDEAHKRIDGVEIKQNEAFNNLTSKIDKLNETILTHFQNNK